jgi:hypothetical protein
MSEHHPTAPRETVKSSQPDVDVRPWRPARPALIVKERGHRGNPAALVSRSSFDAG